MTARMTTAVEVACVLAIVAGVAFVYWPAALIVSGLFGLAFIVLQALGGLR